MLPCSRGLVCRDEAFHDDRKVPFWRWSSLINNGLWNLDSAQEALTTACECGVRLDSRLNYRLSRTLGKHAHTLSKAYIRPVRLHTPVHLGDAF